MADPLSLLQIYHDKTDQIKTHSDHIIFGNLAWPKDVQTSYRIYGTEKDGKWEYYTLDCLLYFLKNIKRSHPDYVKQAKGEKQIVRRVDRRDLVSFLEGNFIVQSATQTYDTILFFNIILIFVSHSGKFTECSINIYTL